MSTSIQKHVPLCEIITDDDDIYYAPLDQMKNIQSDINANMFISLNGEVLARRIIRKIRPSSCKSSLARFSPEIRRQVKERAKMWKGNLNKSAPLEVELMWAEKLVKGEQL